MSSFAWLNGKRVKSPPVQMVTPLQARRALLEAGLLDAVEALVATSPDASLAWQYATEVNRNDPLIATLAYELGMDADQIDEIFLRASQM